MSSGCQEEDAISRPRKKARVSTSFRESAARMQKNTGLCGSTCTGSDDTDEFLEDSALSQLRREVIDVEKFYLKKILVYKLEFESECSQVEKELDDSRASQVCLLLKLKQAKDKIAELEAKNTFYRNRLRKFEEP